ncbi:coronin-7-like isoform X2 [Apostichopus japonicus]|uniref:coronin-7-like isoform X2 n=1 Tax=Stichopus japonicus TaxID=307972 RepID=UPI003AB6A57A
MSRFKVSKFRNAQEKVPHMESWITGLRVGSLPFSHGNHIKASAALMAFNVESGNGGNLAVFPVDAKGRKDMSIPQLQAHSEFVTDFDFNPFDDFQLATCSQDGLIRIWDIPEEGLSTSLSTASLSLPQQDGPVEVISYNPSASSVLAASIKSTLKIFDISSGAEKLSIDGHNDTIQSLSWKQDGRLLATSGKDKTIRIVDPRQSSISSETKGHENEKDSRVCWFGDQDYVLSTGATKSRQRQAFLFDVRNFKQKVTSLSFDPSSGIMIPLYDPDTKMLFIAGKGETTIRFYDVIDSSPFLKECSTYVGKAQQKGAALVNKRALNVMSCEVNRLLQLTQDGVIPVSYEVPRKSHRDFQPELFPDFRGDEPGLTSEEWFEGNNAEVARVSLNPSKAKPVGKKQKGSSSSENKAEKTKTEEVKVQKPDKPAKTTLPQKPSPPSKSTSSKADGVASKVSNGDVVKPAVAVESKSKPKGPILKRFTSKFRHISTVMMHRSLQFTSLKKTSISTMSECDGFHVNKKWAAVPLSGAGGNIAIIDLDKPCKLPESVPFIEHGSDASDFAWDPFDDNRLAVCCLNCKITVWKISGQTSEGFSADIEVVLMGHNDRIYLIKFHPLAKDVLLSASQDLTVKIWNISTGEDKITLEGHTDQIFSAAWSPDGKFVATLCKDGKIRLYEPRSSNSPVQEHNFVSGNKGARILFVLNGTHLIVSGQKNQSTRLVTLLKASDLSRPVHSVDLKTSPSFLIPHYDEDTNILFLSGKGDSTADLFEVLAEPPYLSDLSGFSATSIHQAFSFLPKTICAVKDVEVMRAMRLTMTTMEPVTFTVPRVKKEYFQDDIFPDTRASWEWSLEGSDWFNGENGQEQRRVYLGPEGMKPLSEVPKVNAPPPKYSSQELLEMKSDQEKKEELLSAMTNVLTLNETPLPQEEMEGVEDDEWDD